MKPVPTFVLDAGALIALERAEPTMTALLAQVRAGRARILVPDAVVAQVWRGGSGRQARISVLLGSRSPHYTAVPLDTAAARRIGARIRDAGHVDVVDVHVALVTIDHHASVITSDRGDIVAVDPALSDRVVDI